MATHQTGAWEMTVAPERTTHFVLAIEVNVHRLAHLLGQTLTCIGDVGQDAENWVRGFGGGGDGPGQDSWDAE